MLVTEILKLQVEATVKRLKAERESVESHRKDQADALKDAAALSPAMAVAKAVAEQHGGTLHWARTAGLTRFVIDLPPAAPAPAPEPVA